MNGFTLAMIALGAVAAIAIALLGAVVWTLSTRIKTLSQDMQTRSADYAALEQKFLALRETNQQEIIALGQRILEADKIVRRFSARLDSIENNTPADTAPQYGQLQELLTKAVAQVGEASAAEVELLSLLNRNRK